MSLSVSLSFIFSDLLMMKNTKTVAVSTVLSDRLEAIAYNIAATYNIAAMAQIQPSMLEPADVYTLVRSVADGHQDGGRIHSAQRSS
jgi:hypothetical protein